MADENNNGNDGEDQGNSPETPTEETKDEVRLTQAAFDAIIKREKAQARRAALKEANKPAPSAPSNQAPAQTDPDVLAQIAELRAKNEEMSANLMFAEVLSRMPEASKLNSVQRDTMRKIFDPSEPDKLIDLAKQLFPSLAPEPKSDKPTAGPPATPSVPSFNGGAPSGAPREAALNPVEWEASDIQALRARGEFLTKIEQWKSTLPGSAGLFKRRVPKG